MHISPYLSVFNWCSASKGFDSGKPFTGGGVGWGGLGRAGAGWGRRTQQQKWKHSPVCTGWVGGGISGATSTAGDLRATSPHPLRLVSQALRTYSVTLAGRWHYHLPC